MTIEQFLSFWNQHNTSIIEGLVALIILLSLFLGFRSLFTKKSEEIHEGESLNASQLEKTLQKILENQASSTGPAHSALEDLKAESIHVPTATGDSSAATDVLHTQLAESEKKIEALQVQLVEAQAATAAAASAAAAAGQAAPAAAAVPAAPNAELEAKIRDLESRLAEYEIISEDIADLSRFKEENDKLRSEIEGLKGAAPIAQQAPTPAPAAPAPPPPAAEPAPAAPAPAKAEPTPEELAAQMAPPPSTDESASLVDDDLMKEFAAAVEGQKAQKGAEKSDATKTPEKSEDTQALMNDFENFVSKKS